MWLGQAGPIKPTQPYSGTEFSSPTFPTGATNALQWTDHNNDGLTYDIHPAAVGSRCGTPDLAYAFKDDPRVINRRRLEVRRGVRVRGAIADVADAANCDFRYRAFLCYSHRDSAWADWLHHALESYPIPKSADRAHDTCRRDPGTTRAGVPRPRRAAERDRSFRQGQRCARAIGEPDRDLLAALGAIALGQRGGRDVPASRPRAIGSSVSSSTASPARAHGPDAGTTNACRRR